MTPKLAAIAIMDRNRLIGANNDLPWHLSADLKYFKQVTLGKPVIMGRKTWESFGSKPLPNRPNIVVTRDASYVAQGAMVANSLDQGIRLAKEHNAAEIMIIGGANIYEQALPQLDRLYITLVEAEFEGDAWFPKWAEDQWHEISRETVMEKNTKAGALAGSLEGKEVTLHFVVLEQNKD